MLDKIAASIQQMLVSYRKPLDSGKQSGCGGFVATFFDLYNQILSWSPATESISSGLYGAVDSTDAQSHSFESSTENMTFQSRSLTRQATCNSDRSDQSDEDENIKLNLELKNTNYVGDKEKKVISREKERYAF